MSDSSNAQKTALARNLEQFAQRKAEAAIDLLGQALPASVTAVVSSGIVKVTFELTNIPFTIPEITVPLLGSEYVRLPVQFGMRGFVIPGDAYLGGVSGLGGGTADLSPRPNLSNLVFAPFGSKRWTAVDNPNALVLYGPEGVIIRDEAKTKIIDLTDVTGIVIKIPAGKALTINGALIVNGPLQLDGPIESISGGTYTHDLKTGGNIIAGFGGGDQVGLQTHSHAQPNDSHGDTEGPTAAPTAGT